MISRPGFGASAAMSEAIVNNARPAKNMRRRPNRSPARPPKMMSPPKASVYAVMTQCRSVRAKPTSAWIEGRATFTTVMSRMSMNCAAHSRTRTSQVLRPIATPVGRPAGSTS